MKTTALRTAALALVAVVGILFGCGAADPISLLRSIAALGLGAAGARSESFRGPSGERLHVWELGPLAVETPVVMLHGLGATSEYWAHAAITLARQGRTVLLLDAPGSGLSEAPRSREGYGLAARAAAVESLVKALALSRCDLVGHSLGGWTAGLYAIQKPFRVHRLVLVDPGGFTPVADVDAEIRSLSPVDRAASRRLLDRLFFQKPLPITGFGLDALARNYRRENVTETLAALAEGDALLGREGELPEGTVLVWGERETLFPIADGRRAVSRIRNGRLIALPDAGHDGPIETPSAFEEALRSALR